MTKSRRPWLPSDSDTLKRMHAEGCTDGIIAQKLGCCLNTVLDRRRAAGLAPNHPARYVSREADPVFSRITFRFRRTQHVASGLTT